MYNELSQSQLAYTSIHVKINTNTNTNIHLCTSLYIYISLHPTIPMALHTHITYF